MTREEKTGLTKSAIIKAAIDVFSEKGFTDSSLDEIITRAGVGKGTVYKYFNNKEHLFVSLFEYIFDELFQAIVNDKPKTERSIEDALKSIISTYLDFFQRRNKLFLIILQHFASSKESSKNFIFELLTSRIKYFESLVAKQIEKGTLKNYAPNDIVLSAIGVMTIFVYKWIVSECSFDLKTKEETILSIILSGVAN